jgi:hypothetical protein
MLSQPGLWLIIAGALLVTFGFFGFVFSQNRQRLDEASGEQAASTPIDPPKPFGKKGADNGVRSVPVRYGDATKHVADQLPRRTA